ncbi:HlyD family secretion protein [Bacteroidales bacterium OttesenSCG-928-B11]|nr:HlyD family secretion protein [Bacteroidales bacterium OttesenSCG-928-B11]MDL2326463.1 HlyD family secretion protein [Bacteroidales bacterium OttesenSCG-928-A14]
MKYDIPENIELRSEAVQEILGRPPKWIIRWGITVVFIIVAGLFIGSYFFKYPDVLQATITVTTENLPAGVAAKATGRIDTVFVCEKQSVKEGELLALIENPAKLHDVMLLKQSLQNYTISDTGQYHPVSANMHLGDIQQSYISFLKTREDFQYFTTANYHRKKIGVIEKQITTQKAILQKSRNQLELSGKQLSGAHHLFSIDSSLYAKNMLSRTDFENARNSYIQQLQSHESAKLSIDNQQMSILQSEQTIFDLEQQRTEQRNNLLVALMGAYDLLLTQIKNWEQSYLLTSPCDGMATFTKYWQRNQNINAGEVFVTIVPEETTRIIGKILLPPQGAGKVKEGQMVNVKFDNFPHMEYGMVRVQIRNISLVPIQVDEKNKAYMLEVLFPERLQTNYGKDLDFSQEMTGTAEIITEDLRLLDKFINPIKAIIKK